MNYGFIIDNRKCIGCHACSTACKAENQVPLGVNRTWVKQVEKGAFPHTRRLFQVTRCNHCANPPCVRICPVEAMYQRDDGIVDFDPRICIGCKACLQACPYDAIYVDPDDGTAAKCHYCAHRTEIGLEPACVVVCPEHAIISGDLDDPHSEISRLLARQEVSVRKPEQGTAPKLFYIDADTVTVTPTASSINGAFAFVDLGTDQARAMAARRDGHNGQRARIHLHETTATPVRKATEQGVPIQIGDGRFAGQLIQTVYNAQHKIPWHWPVPAYLVTKAIGSGVFMLLAIIFGLDLVEFQRPLAVIGAFIALAFTSLTTLLLVLDLERPERFYTILTRPQWKSWLTRGAFILIGFSAVTGLWFLVEGAVLLDLSAAAFAATARPFFLSVGFALAAASAVYTAFLFAQAEGRDLWQSTLLPFHLMLQAIVAGGASLLVLSLFITVPPPVTTIVLWAFGASLLLNIFVTLVGEFGMPHASETAAAAARAIKHGRYRVHFWGGAILLGHVIPLALLAATITTGVFLLPVAAVAAVTALIGLYLFEHAYVMAPQEVPNS